MARASHGGQNTGRKFEVMLSVLVASDVLMTRTDCRSRAARHVTGGGVRRENWGALSATPRSSQGTPPYLMVHSSKLQFKINSAEW
jgi:hypothetical protein